MKKFPYILLYLMFISLGIATQLNAADIEDVQGEYNLFANVKFKAKGLGTVVEEEEGNILTLNSDGTFTLGPVSGDFELDAKGKKILFVAFDAGGLDALADGFRVLIAGLVVTKFGIFMNPNDIQVDFQPFKVSKIKIDKKTNLPTGKFKVAIKGIASADVPGEGPQQTKFSFKGKFTILEKL